jgi:hypothetical protein
MEEKEGEGGSLLLDTLYIAARGGPTQLVAVAPETDVHHSKRYDGLVVQARELDHKKRFLREQALDKERVFKLNTHNLETRIAEFRLKLAAEVAARDAQLARARDAFKATLACSVQDVEEQLAASVDAVQCEWLPPPARRLDAWQAAFDHFVNHTVPETIENQSGRVTRHLIKAQETFEIDNTKLLRREKRINERFEAHVDNARANLREVSRKRQDCLRIAEEDIFHEERASDRAEETHMAKTHTRIAQVQDMQSGLADIRASTDSEILLAIETASSRLQKSVLDNFGTQSAASK